jgi:hypothetical protein
MPTTDLTQFRAEDASSTKRRVQGIYTGPASYATGGDPFVAADIKLGQIDVLQLGHPVNATVVLVAEYDYTNFKVKWYDLAGNEIANATALSGYSTRFEAIGR